MTEGLSPRARAILEAVEREVEALKQGRLPAREQPLRADRTLLTALELAVSGASRDDVRAQLTIRDDVLDAVFGDGSPPQMRLKRRG